LTRETYVTLEDRHLLTALPAGYFKARMLSGGFGCLDIHVPALYWHNPALIGERRSQSPCFGFLFGAGEYIVPVSGSYPEPTPILGVLNTPE